MSTKYLLSFYFLCYAYHSKQKFSWRILLNLLINCCILNELIDLCHTNTRKCDLKLKHKSARYANITNIGNLEKNSNDFRHIQKMSLHIEMNMLRRSGCVILDWFPNWKRKTNWRLQPYPRAKGEMWNVHNVLVFGIICCSKLYNAHIKSKALSPDGRCVNIAPNLR